ncbi:type I CRISPR-associated protein Cas7 [Methanobrevibacter sp. AbM4]|uniref:type I CRISPR-associated protein Cas7 n=1 Tax=Methanobrevibacter sp. AbM4 TaxID=224719 RepID=UPI0003348EA0|nr:type I CRISPR-associated protein Cas7 [Methanobrevibacter sp. AbM4]AGN16031.1 CRISPR-associated protein Cas7 [Methanobrevibacter sp. AbM4]
METDKEYVKNYYQGIYLTETILGNPNGDFVDNSPRNFDGEIFTTDKCIKYNVRKYIHESVEDLENKENIVFFFPRLVQGAKKEENKFKTRDDVFEFFKNEENPFESLIKCSPDVRMFGGTFSFKNEDSKQIYGPIQLTYGADINNAQIKRIQIGAPFATENGQQKTNGSEAIVDDAIISYDITINPNVYKNLLLKSDLELFKKSLWFGTNLRKSTSKKTDSKLLILIKFINEDNTILNIGELKELIEVSNKKQHKVNHETLKLNCDKLFKKLDKYCDFIESIDLYYDSDELILEYEGETLNEKTQCKLSDKFSFKDPIDLIEN